MHAHDQCYTEYENRCWNTFKLMMCLSSLVHLFMHRLRVHDAMQ